MTPSKFNQAILKWFAEHGRTDLPWQKAINPYRVWISEIMLQQTQVSTVIPYYERFLASFPSVKPLAAASEDQVLSHWSGLGYYARARNLHKTAKQIQQQYQGDFPNSVEKLSALPGIGRSTAGAIISIAMNGRAPILDGNVKRVLSRFHAVEGWAGQSAVAAKLWQYAEDYTPKSNVAAYTQAIMDLGATVCTRTKPQCHQCPLSRNCAAHLSDQVTAFPQRKLKFNIPTKQSYCLILKNQNGEVLLEKRPPSGIWGGLWSLPEDRDKNTLYERWQQRLGCEINNPSECDKLRHTFSHFHLELQPIQAQIQYQSTQIQDSDRWRWYQAEELKKIGLAAPIKKLLERG
ncbi:MAG: A/G-specific adenine glycosylase [Pseudomonadales bacterium]|nr:A/G-specific adenine glycosylase [Pseudomonadales bacterium]